MSKLNVNVGMKTHLSKILLLKHHTESKTTVLSLALIRGFSGSVCLSCL